MNILRTFSNTVSHQFRINILLKSILSWLDFDWLEKSGYVATMDIAMPPLEIGFVYLELSNDIESFYSGSHYEN